MEVPTSRVYRLATKIKREATWPPFSARNLVSASVLQHDGQEGEQHEGLDQREAKQQHREYAAAGSRIASRAFARSRDCAPIAGKNHDLPGCASVAAAPGTCAIAVATVNSIISADRANSFNLIIVFLLRPRGPPRRYTFIGGFELRSVVRQTSVCRRVVAAPLWNPDKLKFVGHPASEAQLSKREGVTGSARNNFHAPGIRLLPF